MQCAGGHAHRNLLNIFFGRFCGALLELQFSIPGIFHGLYNILFHARNFWFWIWLTATLDMTKEAARVEVPTLLCWGKYDYTCPLSAGYKYSDAMPTSQMHVCQQGSHNWLIQRPEEFTEVLTKFISEGPGTGKKDA